VASAAKAAEQFELILINFSLILDAKNTRVASTAKAAERILFEM
jgi:hypothetical protein